MTRDPTTATSSTIYKDGDPVTVQLGANESVTVPSNVDWVLSVHANNETSATYYYAINGTRVGVPPDGSIAFDAVVSDGDTFGSDNADISLTLSGWEI